MAKARLDLISEQMWFTKQLAHDTGLDPVVLLAWITAESGYGQGVGHNYLNVHADSNRKSYSGVPLASVSTHGFARFKTPQDAEKETAHWINRFSNFRPIKAAAGKPAGVQLAAIANSKWDANHYRGNTGKNGATLVGAFKTVSRQPNEVLDVLKGTGEMAAGAGLGALSGARLGPLGALAGAVGGAAGGAAVASGDLPNVQHGVETAAHILVQGLVDVVLVVFASLLLYTGIRRMSGDALPSPTAALPGRGLAREVEA
jgi:hypothetical protein